MARHPRAGPRSLRACSPGSTSSATRARGSGGSPCGWAVSSASQRPGSFGKQTKQTAASGKAQRRCCDDFYSRRSDLWIEQDRVGSGYLWGPSPQLLSMGAHDGGQDSAFWEMQKWPHSSPMPTKPSMAVNLSSHPQGLLGTRLNGIPTAGKEAHRESTRAGLAHLHRPLGFWGSKVPLGSKIDKWGWSDR